MNIFLLEMEYLFYAFDNLDEEHSNKFITDHLKTPYIQHIHTSNNRSLLSTVIRETHFNLIYCILWIT